MWFEITPGIQGTGTCRGSEPNHLRKFAMITPWRLSEQQLTLHVAVTWLPNSQARFALNLLYKSEAFGIMDAADFDWLQMLFGRGREEPLPTDSHPRLEGKDIPSLAKYMKSDKCKNVFVMVITASNQLNILSFSWPSVFLSLAQVNHLHPSIWFDIFNMSMSQP